MGKIAAGGVARKGYGVERGRAGGARDDRGKVVSHENGDTGGESCGCCKDCSVCGGEACDTELGGFLCLHMLGRAVYCSHAIWFAAA